MINLDHAATTPLRPEALNAMLPYFTEHAANANALYAEGGARGRRLTLRVGRLRTPFTLNRPKSISRAADRKPTTGRCSARCALWLKKAIL